MSCGTHHGIPGVAFELGTCGDARISSCVVFHQQSNRNIEELGYDARRLIYISHKEPLWRDALGDVALAAAANHRTCCELA